MLNMKGLKLEECFHFRKGYLPDLPSGISYICHQYTGIIFVKNGMTFKVIYFCFFSKIGLTNKYLPSSVQDIWRLLTGMKWIIMLPFYRKIYLHIFFCKKRQKNPVQCKKLVWGIGDTWRLWMIENWS